MIHSDKAINWKEKENTDRLGTSVTACHKDNKSVLKYGIIFWGGDHKDFKDIFKLQKKCIRAIKGGKNRVSCRNLFRELKTLMGISLYIFEIICFMKKKIRFTLPSTLMSMVIILVINEIYIFNFVILSVVKEA
jgi:hypothetical protein